MVSLPVNRAREKKISLANQGRYILSCWRKNAARNRGSSPKVIVKHLTVEVCSTLFQVFFFFFFFLQLFITRRPNAVRVVSTTGIDYQKKLYSKGAWYSPASTPSKVDLKWQ